MTSFQLFWGLTSIVASCLSSDLWCLLSDGFSPEFFFLFLLSGLLLLLLGDRTEGSAWVMNLVKDNWLTVGVLGSKSFVSLVLIFFRFFLTYF